MEEIENILEKASKKEINIPPKIQYRVNYTLQNKGKKEWKYYMKKMIAVLATFIIVFIGSVSVYAAFGGTINGKPVVEWIGIKFSDEYKDYVEKVEEQKIVRDNTEVELTSTMCDEGFTVLEFTINLSEKDREYLRLDQNVISEEELKKAEEENDKMIIESKDLKNTVQIMFDPIEEERNGIITYFNNNKKIVIDGREVWTNVSLQSVTKISDYQYKVYQMYFLTDKELEGKTDFTINLKNIIIGNEAEKPSNDIDGAYLSNVQSNARYIEFGGEFSVNLSKKKALENTETKEINKEVLTYKNMTKIVEKVTFTPMQTILKIKSVIKDVNLTSLQSTRDKNYIGAFYYKVYDNNGNELKEFNSEVSRSIKYEDGRIEEWARGDIGTYKYFKNATLELIDYMIIEKKDIESLKIVPTVEEFNNGNREMKELTSFTIDLK